MILCSILRLISKRPAQVWLSSEIRFAKQDSGKKFPILQRAYFFRFLARTIAQHAVSGCERQLALLA